MEELKNAREEYKKRQKAELQEIVQSEIQRIMQAKDTISEKQCVEQAKDVYIRTGSFDPTLLACQRTIPAKEIQGLTPNGSWKDYAVHSRIYKHFRSQAGLNFSVRMCSKREYDDMDEVGFAYQTFRECPSSEYCYRVSLNPEVLINKSTSAEKK